MSQFHVLGHQTMAIRQDERVFFAAMGERIAARRKMQQKFVIQVPDSVIGSIGTMNTRR